MGTRWTEQARTLLQEDARGWIGLWSLLDAAGHGALALSLATSLGVGVDLAFAAIELGEARDEVEWLHERPTQRRPARLGPLHVADDLAEARQVVEQLVDTATTRTLLLIDEAAAPAEFGCLGRVLRKLRAAGEELARAAA